MKRTRLPILTIATVGNPQFPRFAVRTDHGMFWTGNGKRFCRCVKEAQLHKEYNDAATASAECLKILAGGGEPRRYVVPMVIEVYSDEPVDQAKLAHYLSKSMRFTCNARENGHGPDGSLVQSGVDWTEMKKADTNENQNSLPVV